MGFKIYVPFGIDWYNKFKYANYNNNNIDVAHQYLTHIKNWINFADDLSNVNFLTLEEYGDIDLDIHLSSNSENIPSFLSISEKYDKKTKHIFHAGNNFPTSIIDGYINNLISSSTIVYESSKIKNKCFHHQEFDLNFFKPRLPCPNINSIYSIQHYFKKDMHPFKNDYLLFLKIKNSFPSFDISCYGAGTERGPITNSPQKMSEFYKNTGFIFHVKPQGDGYGHIYHNSYACGKPVIYKSEYLKSNGKEMTPMMLFDEDTSIDLSLLNLHDVINKINFFKDNYSDVSSKVYKKFKSIVDFDKEYDIIKKFINNLV